MSEITTQEMINKLEVLQARTWSLMGLVEGLKDKQSSKLIRELAQWQFDAIEFIDMLSISNGNKTNVITLLSKMNLEYTTTYPFHIMDGYLLSIRTILDKIEEQNDEIS